MRRSTALAIGVAIAAVFAAGLVWYRNLPPAPTEWQGYAEADFVKVGPTQQGLLTEVMVARGDEIAAGAPLFAQDDALAACVLHQPKLLLLDEPTAGVDVKARREFWDLIHDMAAEGLTVLVSTHYMDEAERCKRIVYLANGRIVVQGDAFALARASGLITYEATGESIDEAARRIRRVPGVEAAAVFGRALHVAGTDRVMLEGAIRSFADLTWHEVEPRLEDVFIHQLTASEAR